MKAGAVRSVSSFSTRYRTASDIYGLAAQAPEPKDQFTTYEAIHAPLSKPRVRVQAFTQSTPPDGPIVRVLGIGDVHCKPGRTHEPVILAGRHAAATKPDRVIAIGDWASLDSCSFHPAKGSAKDSERPAFHEELAALEDSLEAFGSECPANIPLDITLGNHEHRAWRMANADPRVAGDFPLRLEQAFARYRWKTHEYGKWLYRHGVGFVHVPLNAMGREYGGKNSENTIGNDATHSVVWGHDHRYRHKTVPKIGPNNRITLTNLGTCMPSARPAGPTASRISRFRMASSSPRASMTNSN
ncbi:MAG TPA: metallophosphoesterase [Kaistia sp.]|nr:metallophosphoesterase [Kaistia sp.]